MLSRNQPIQPTPREPLDLSLESIHLLANGANRVPDNRVQVHRSVSLERERNNSPTQPQFQNFNRENYSNSEQRGAQMTDSGIQRDRPSDTVWGGLDGVSGQ